MNRKSELVTFFLVTAALALLLALGLSLAAKADAQDYTSIGHSRSGSKMFFTQGVSGEYDLRKEQKGDDAVQTPWKGYGIKSAIGLEVRRFVDFSLTHTFLMMRNASEGLERMSGSRLSGDLAFVFASPVGNLKIGGGLVGSRLDYQNATQSADYYGSGSYYSLGLNYFVTPRFSLYGDYQVYRQRLTKTGGEADSSKIQSRAATADFGFSVWLNWL